MKNYFLTLIITGISLWTYSQKASDYLNLDTSLVVTELFLGKDTMEYRFERSFDYQGDTICYFSRRNIKRPEVNLTYMAFNKDTLIIGSSLVLNPDNFLGISSEDLKIVMPRKDQPTVREHISSFDMSTTKFEITSELIDVYTASNGTVFNNVVKIDQYNVTDDFHYYTYLAPNIGIIYVGPDYRAERQFLISRK
jgi:hypothetical protein